MAYYGERASHSSLSGFFDSDRAMDFKNRIQSSPESSRMKVKPTLVHSSKETLPRFLISFDGSYIEIPLSNSEATVGREAGELGGISVASVLFDLDVLFNLGSRPADPVKVRNAEVSDNHCFFLPGGSTVLSGCNSPFESFRKELYTVLKESGNNESLLDTYEHLLSMRSKGTSKFSSAEFQCPHAFFGENHINPMIIPSPGINICGECFKELYSSDALRIHERFRNMGSNGEAFGLAMQAVERITLVNFMRRLEKESVEKLADTVFLVDGPLAVFGTSAWLSSSVKNEVKRLASVLKGRTGKNLLLAGVEKSGEFAAHFERVDKDGEVFPPRSVFLPDDEYIHERIVFRDGKRFGQDTYFGRKAFYKSMRGSRIVLNIAFLNDDQDTLDSTDISLYPQLPILCDMVDRMCTSFYENALIPVMSAHASASIPRKFGEHVLKKMIGK